MKHFKSTLGLVGMAALMMTANANAEVDWDKVGDRIDNRLDVRGESVNDRLDVRGGEETVPALSADDWELLAEGDLQLIEDLEFYDWLPEEETTG